MGTCTCEIHLDGEPKTLINKDSKENNQYIPIMDLNSDLSKNSEIIKLKNKKININNKSILEKKLKEIGKFIPKNEFEKLINNEINYVMKHKKVDFGKYIAIDLSSNFELNPFQFNKTNDIYKGSWNEDMEIEGYGIYYNYSKEIIIEGIWQNGINIYGRIFFPNKEIYQGEIKNSLPNGKGEYYNSNGDKYKGTFINGEISGNCEIMFEDNAKFEGNIEKGHFQGEGKMTWENNIVYIGNFKNSMLEGKGSISMIINMKKEKYEGDFSENEFNGKGKYIFNNGDEYKGEFENGIKKGKGIYTKNSEDKGKIIFEGIWSDDLPNGNGVLSYGKNKLKGFWRNGDFMSFNDDNKDINNSSFINIDKNIKPPNINIFPNSLSHLNQNMNFSRYTNEDLI